MKKALFLFLMVCSVPAFGQVTFQFIPEISGRSVDGLLNCNIVNPGGIRAASLRVTVTERKNGMVLTLQTAPFTLAPGTSRIPAPAIRGTRIQYSGNPISVIIRHDHNFPEGDYEYCFTLDFPATATDAPAEQCFQYGLVPFAQMHLIEPYDRDTICDKRPILSWQPLLPTPAGAAYQVVLSEIKPGQNAIEALNYNLPVINQSRLLSPILPYPAILNQLEEGKSYAWQVTAYQDQIILNRSEVWEFRVQCREQKKDTVLADDGYRDIGDLLKGNYYVAVELLKFAVFNPYKPGTFKYTIESLSNPGKKIKNLPRVRLETGQNKIRVDLANTDSFTDGNTYLLTVWLPDGSTKNLRFIYKD
jgi:hypothetical protein